MPASVRLTITLLLLLGLAWGAGGGCGSDQKPVSAKAAQFRERALSLLKNAKQRLGPLAASDKRAQLGRAMRDLYRDSLAAGQALPCGVAVVGGDGRAVMGAFPDPQAPGGLMVVSGDKDYSQYDKMRQAIASRGISHFTLYTSDGPVYMICSPLNQDGRSGLVCLAFFQVTMRGELGVSDEDFVSLNFN